LAIFLVLKSLCIGSEDKVKIAIITDTFLPSANGMVTRLCQSIRLLKEDGHTVTIIAPDSGVSDFEGTPIAGISTNFSRRKIKSYLREFQPDLVHVVDPASLGVAGIYYTKRLGLPLIVSYHTQVPKYMDNDHHPFLSRVLGRYYKNIYHQADLNLCTSEPIMKKLKEGHFKNIQLLNHGIDTNLYQPIRFDAAMRDRLTGGQKDKKLLLYVGRLAPENRIENLREVLEKSNDCCLAIVGEGPHRRFLENYFKETDTVFIGRLYGEELASAYASSDIFVFPSTTRTAGLVLLEAMASGLPVLAAKCGPTCEQVKHGITGLLYDPTAQDELISFLSLLKDDLYRLQLAEQARTVSQMANWEGNSEQLLDFYKETLLKHSN
jgi:glycosyltransferase involved in cell wall biosynthesis